MDQSARDEHSSSDQRQVKVGNARSNLADEFLQMGDEEDNSVSGKNEQTMTKDELQGQLIQIEANNDSHEIDKTDAQVKFMQSLPSNYLLQSSMYSNENSRSMVNPNEMSQPMNINGGTYQSGVHSVYGTNPYT